MIKKVIQQGRSDFGARSVLPVREHDKMARTPLVAFFNIPFMKLKTCDGGENSAFVKVLRISDSAVLQDS
jgi:hypothetical protein